MSLCKSRFFEILSLFAVVVALMISLNSLEARGKKGPDPYYKIPSIFQPCPSSTGRSWNVQNFGPVGIGIDLVRPGMTMKINRVEKGSPAEKTGKLKKGQIIESINGKVLKDKDPRELLGEWLAEAEAKDGKINLKIKGVGNVLVQIPVLGPYSKTWPLNCKKSDKIVRNLADVIAKQEKPRWGSVLFLLSTGEDKDLEVVKKWMKTIKPHSMNWSIGYNGIGICEYYLRTGDKSVLPIIKEMSETLKKNMYNGGWSGRGQPASFSYSTGTGQVHASGVNCVTFLLMARLCGVDVDEFTLQRSLKAFFRFAGRGNVAYGDGLPEGGFRDNGKSASHAVGMAAATLLDPKGESSLYAKTRDNYAMKSFYATNWFHAAHTGGGMGEIWHNAAMNLVAKKRPTPYRSFIDTRKWCMDLSRRHDGSLGIGGMTDRYDKSATEHDRSWGTFFGLTYTLPRKKLQLFGAPRSPYAKTHKLPARPWGSPADDIFQSPLPVKHSSISMADLMKEKVETDASLPVLKIIGDSKVSDKVLLKYMHHPEFGLRSAAMRSANNFGRYHLVLPMLKSSDPRLRHNGILAITGMFKGRGMPGDKITPEMWAEVEKMVNNPNESWWVLQDAINALGKAGKAKIAKNRDRLMKILEIDSIWVQMAAVKALAKLANDPAHYKIVLPKILAMTSSFWNDAASYQCTREIANQIKSAPPKVKTYAIPLVKATYEKIPGSFIAKGGAYQANASKIVKSRFGAIMKSLPGGDEFVKTRPKTTLVSAQSGNKKDMYTYSGKFKPNKALEGTWQWVLWPAPKNPGEIDKCINQFMKGWVKGGKKPIQRPKDTLQLSKGGKVKSNFFKGYFWSGDMLIDPNGSEAKKMILKTVDGVQFLLVEKGEFDKVPKGGHCGYHGYKKK